MVTQSRVKGFWLLLALLALVGLSRWLPWATAINHGVALLVCIALLWLSEAVHITLTALLVPVLAVILQLLPLTQALSHFANPVLYLFLGGFALAAALHRQQLDTELARWLIHLAGGRLSRAVLLLFMATLLLSMWISNTATVAIMLPLAMGLLANIDREHQLNTHTFVLLGVAYSANIGGMGTLVGSPPNAIAAGYAHLGFMDWMQFGVPVMLLFWPLALAVLYLLLRPNLDHPILAEETTSVWQWTPPRICTLLIFASTVLAWIFSGPLSSWLGGIEQFDSLVALLAVIAVGVSGVASWREIEQQTEWGVLLLFGGGLCLSAVLQSSGTSAFLASQLMAWCYGAPSWVLILAIATFVVFLTELASNTAVAALLIPLFAPLASGLGFSSTMMAVMVALAASCAFMLPVATPPNAMVYATGRVPQRQMLRVGLVLNIGCSLVLALLVALSG